MKVVLASANPGKLRELSRLLADLDMTLLPQSEFGIESPEEPHLTFVENALLKARHASVQTGLPAIADDSGLSVPALGGAPGVRSARYAGVGATDAHNNDKLIQELRGHADRSAHYDCVMIFLHHATDPAPLIATGRWHGRIADAARGSNGFGYDPHFLVASPVGATERTAAELDEEEKNRISHRGQASARLIELLRGGIER